jgi:hypothetical protein
MIRRFFAPIALATLFAVFCTLANGPAARAAVIVTTATPRCSAASADSTSLHHAGLVVTFGDRHTEAFCIEFSEDTISGLQLLQRSGLPLVTSSASGLGAAVCSIDGEGSNDPTNCFASCTGDTCAYWAYYQFVDGAWKFSQLGAAQRTVYDGDIDGWAWGPGGLSSGAIPEQPGALCPEPPSPTPVAPTPTPDVAHQPSSTPSLSTFTPVPSSTSVPVPAPGEVTTVPSTEPSRDANVEPSGPSDDFAPTPPQENVVAGVQLTPPGTAAATPPSPARVTASPTPRIGAVVVSNEQGTTNESRSESRTPTSAGSRWSLIAFGAVIFALIVVAGVVLYRRRLVG